MEGENNVILHFDCQEDLLKIVNFHSILFWINHFELINKLDFFLTKEQFEEHLL
jgi:hypothetical protein